jgi:mRNA interferase RelE/StbE
MQKPGNEWEIHYLDAVLTHDIPAINASERQRIKRAIESKLTTRPELFGKPLRFSLKGARSLRVGDYRVLFVLEDRRVLIVGIYHRSVAYHQAQNRIN